MSASIIECSAIVSAYKEESIKLDSFFKMSSVPTNGKQTKVTYFKNSFKDVNDCSLPNTFNYRSDKLIPFLNNSPFINKEKSDTIVKNFTINISKSNSGELFEFFQILDDAWLLAVKALNKGNKPCHSMIKSFGGKQQDIKLDDPKIKLRFDLTKYPAAFVSKAGKPKSIVLDWNTLEYKDLPNGKREETFKEFTVPTTSVNEEGETIETFSTINETNAGKIFMNGTKIMRLRFSMEQSNLSAFGYSNPVTIMRIVIDNSEATPYSEESLSNDCV